MSFESFVALRYLAASRRRAHVALISTISILGLAVGVAALVISLSLLSGFQDRIRAQMAQRSPHLRVSPARGATLADPGRVAEALGSLAGIVRVDPAIEGRGWASGRALESTLPVRYRNAPAGELPAALTEAPPPARVSASVATRTRTEPGDLLTVTSSRTRLSPLGPIPVAVVVRIADVRRASALERTPDVEVPEETARLLSGIATGARAYEARLSSPDRAESAARAVSMILGPEYRVETWRELNAPLSFALRLEKAVIFATVALVIVVAALTIVSNIALTVVEKKRDLGVLTSLGATPRSLARIYLILGAVIGATGTGLGIAIGVTASVLLDRYEVVSLPADVYLLTHVPFAVHPGEVALVAAFALVTAIAAAVLPARAAARLAAGEAIRLSR
ncbi:MAG TPA: FtsX-like permease family protein [Thermoanaerobaculia bacterium]|jgi:lipoprotein-releasing system permease protein|nr:FtsX-like permease family protein [Thermoanaerobaculia bacterium]